jgi:hypothetical protein
LISRKDYRIKLDIVRGCNGFLRSTINLYINKKEKTKERRTLYYSSINTNVFLSCLGNISIVR